jgi:hypothetical protein
MTFMREILKTGTLPSNVDPDDATWARTWFVWLSTVAVTFAVLETAAVLRDNRRPSYTLSDTIRRWSAKQPLVGVLTSAAFCGLGVHFFGQKNEE